MALLPSGACARCGASWALINEQWLWKDKHGRAGMQPTLGESDPPPLSICPVCKASVKPAGKARVEEVTHP